MSEFLKIIREICQEEKIVLTSFGGDWVHCLEKDGKRGFIHGYQFSLNPDSVQALCKDKGAMWEVLFRAGIPAVPHHYMMNPQAGQFYPSEGNGPLWNHLMQAYDAWVVKDNEGTGGELVFPARTPAQAEQALGMVFAKGKDAAISPLLPVERECRVILLKGQVRAVYEKTLTAHSDPWKHNLGQGAVPQMVKAGKGRQELENLAQQGAACAGLVFGAVDLVYAKERWQILEINGGVMMEYLARQSADWRFLAKTIYRDGILSMLKG